MRGFENCTCLSSRCWCQQAEHDQAMDKRKAATLQLVCGKCKLLHARGRVSRLRRRSTIQFACKAGWYPPSLNFRSVGKSADVGLRSWSLAHVSGSRPLVKLWPRTVATKKQFWNSTTFGWVLTVLWRRTIPGSEKYLLWLQTIKTTAKHGPERRVLRLRVQPCGELDSERVRCSIARRFTGELSVIADRNHSSG